MKGKYIATKLDNGAKLFYAKNKINKSTCVDVLFNCGSRCDTIPGLAHFTEHMFFTGTKTLSKEEISKKYATFIRTNAYTNVREIAFTGTIFSNELANYLSTVAMLITESTFNQQAVENERKIINQEITEYSDKFEEIAHTFNLYNLYQIAPYKERVTTVGSVKSIAKITSKDIKKFVKTYFVANNCEIYITSPLKVGKIKSIANKMLISRLPQNPNLPDLPYHFYDIADNNFFKTNKENIEKTYIRLNLTFPKGMDDYEFEQKMIMAQRMINDNSYGLDNFLRLKKSLVYNSWMNYWNYKSNSVLAFYCNCQKENVNEIIKTVANYLKNLYQNGFTDNELKKAKRKYKHSEMCKEPSVGNAIGKLYDYRFFGKIRDSKKLKKIRENATIEDCNKVVQEALKNCKVSLSLYGDFNKQTLITKTQLNNLFKF